MGEGTRLAAATGAWICFEDEAGQTLRPPRARTWARRGHTPVVTVSGSRSGRVSVAGLACLKPGAPARLSCRIRIHRSRRGERRSMSEDGCAALITAAHRTLKAPVIVIWDNLNTHISGVMRQFTSGHPDWLTVANLKNSLGNLAAGTIDELAGAIRSRLRRIQHRPDLISGFFGQTGPALEPP